MFLDGLRTKLLTTKSERGMQARIVVSTFLFLVSMILLGYSLYFLYVFQAYNSTTSYFPWAWNDGFTSLGPVAALSVSGILVGIFVGGISIGAVLYLRNELKELRGSTYLPSMRHYDREKTIALIILFVVAIVLIISGLAIGFKSGVWTNGTSGGGTEALVWGSIGLGLVCLALSIVWKTFSD